MNVIELCELEKLQNSTNLRNNTREAIKILLASINDWPTPIIDLNDYKRVISNFVGATITKNEIESCLSKIDYTKNAWEAESLSQLVELFSYFNNRVTLEEVLTELKNMMDDELKCIDR